MTLSIAESCTGGFLSSCFTSFSGASDYFKGSLITYSNEAKIKFLDINKLYLYGKVDIGGQDNQTGTTLGTKTGLSYTIATFKK